MTFRPTGEPKTPRQSVRKVEPVIGAKKHRLLLTKDMGHNANGDRVVQVLCDCGTEKVIQFGNFGTTTKSCGCYRRDKTTRQSTGNLENVAANKVYHSCTRRCRVNNWAIDLTRDTVKELIFADRCYYCNRTREESGTVWYRKDQTLQRKITRLGIDRVDSALGYLKSNCVPCCFDCNPIKLDRPLDLLASLLPGMLGRITGSLHLDESVDEHY